MNRAGSSRSLAGLTLADRYVLEERIGGGTCGRVYRARQLALDRLVAVKVLRTEWSDNEHLLERFHDEAVVAGRISHPNIVSIFDHGQSKGYLYIVMEYLGGATLGDLVRGAPPMAVDRAVALFAQVMRGLGAAHAASVIHADIKPDNVVVSYAQTLERAKLVDFGLARFARHCEGVCEVEDHEVSGTPDYIAPEVVLGHGHSVSGDLYSAGAMLYELLAGVPPFHGDDIEAVLERHVHMAPEAPSGRRRDDAIGPSLDAVVLRALAKDPNERYQSAAELRIAVERAVTEAAVISPMRAMERPIERYRRAVGEAIAAGDAEQICAAYVALAGALSADGRHAAAAAELTEGIDVVTLGGGPAIEDGPVSLWQLLAALARAYMRGHRTRRAQTIALHALRHAVRARSDVGRRDVQSLLLALSPVRAVSAVYG